MIEQDTNILNCDVTLVSKDNVRIGEKFTTSTQLLLRNSGSTSTSNQHKIHVDENNAGRTRNFNNLLIVTPLLNNILEKGHITIEEQNSSLVSAVSKNVSSKANTSKPENYSLLDEVLDFDYLSSGSDEVGVHKIRDKPVVCRAKASLPAKFLCIQSVPSKNNSKKNEEFGIFAKKDLPKRTLFGPMEGMVKDITSDSEDDDKIQFILDYDGEFKKLDVSNNYVSNWMRYVRPAKNIEEQNLILHQNGRNLYFSTFRNIKAKEELKVWYSASYANARNLTLLPEKIELIRRSRHCTQSSLWSCSHCRTSFKSATLLNLHVLTHAADNIETKEDNGNNVKKAKLKSRSARNIKKFMEATETFVCNLCSKTFLSARSLERHIKFHQMGSVYECPICKSKFLRLMNLKKHIPTHVVDDIYSCPDCDKKFSAYIMIRNHIRTYHSGKKFHCDECSKSFRTADKLRIHMLSHSDLKEFLCANCGKQFKRKDKLSDHMKRFHFPGSEKMAPKRRKNNKKYNPQKEASNNDFEPFVYKCHICVIGFKRRGMLVNHLASRHPEVAPDSVPELNLPILKANKDFFCQYCDKVYKSSSKRKAHILKNHPGAKLPISSREVPKTSEGEENGTYSQTVGSFTANPQGCEWCHKQYASKAKLLQHQRKKHNELLPKSLQVPKRRTAAVNYEDEIDPVNVGKVTDSDILLFQDTTDSNISDGEFIIDANTLKRALKGEVFIADCSPETLAELGQIIESRPDQYFRVYQSSSGITFARPVEVWDPLSTCQTLSPTDNSPPLGELKLN